VDAPVVAQVAWAVATLLAVPATFLVPPAQGGAVDEPAARASTSPPALTTSTTTTTTAAGSTTTAAPARRTPAEVEASRRCPEFEGLFAQHGLEPVRTFSYIAWRETRCDPTKVNAEFGANGRPTKTLNRDGSYDVGLLQINSTWKTVTHEVCGTPWGQMSALVDLDCNLRVAKFLLDNGGLGHWEP
jgi:hypothetical protein